MVRRRATFSPAQTAHIQTYSPRPDETPEEYQARIEEAVVREREEDEERERLHPTVLCSCYGRIDARHLARHQRSKTHQAQINWYINYHSTHPVWRLTDPEPIPEPSPEPEPIPEPSPEPEDEPEDDNLTDDLISFANREIVAGYPLASCLFYARYCDYAAETYGGSRNPLPFDEVDAILTDAMGLATIDDEYHA